jgi:hypothetical protein
VFCYHLIGFDFINNLYKYLLKTIVYLNKLNEKMAEDLDTNKLNGIEESEQSDSVSKPQKKLAKHDSGAADLEKVTDFEEEKEISSQDIAGVGLHSH